MATTGTRRRYRPSYDVLDTISSVDLFFDKPQPKKKRRNTLGVYEVECVIADRKSSEGNQYLLKWKHYSSFYNSWEPEHHLTPALLDCYFKPTPTSDLIQEHVDRLRRNIMESLRAKAVIQTISMEFRHDVYKFLFDGKGARNGNWTVFNRCDLKQAGKYLPVDWDCLYNQHGEGYKMKYPIKMRWFLSPAPKHFVLSVDKLTVVPAAYTEKLTLSFIKDPCSCLKEN